MKSSPTKTALAFGGLIASFYNTYGERNAKKALRLAVKANRSRFVQLLGRKPATRKT